MTLLDYSKLSPAMQEKVVAAYIFRRTSTQPATIAALVKRGWLVQDDVYPSYYVLTHYGRESYEQYHRDEYGKPAKWDYAIEAHAAPPPNEGASPPDAAPHPFTIDGYPATRAELEAQIRLDTDNGLLDMAALHRAQLDAETPAAAPDTCERCGNPEPGGGMCAACDAILEAATQPRAPEPEEKPRNSARADMFPSYAKWLDEQTAPGLTPEQEAHYEAYGDGYEAGLKDHARLFAELQTLRAELDTAREANEQHQLDWQDVQRRVQDANDQLRWRTQERDEARAQVAALVEALRPFADIYIHARSIGRKPLDEVVYMEYAPGQPDNLVAITVRNLLHAADVLDRAAARVASAEEAK